MISMTPSGEDDYNDNEDDNNDNEGDNNDNDPCKTERRPRQNDLHPCFTEMGWFLEITYSCTEITHLRWQGTWIGHFRVHLSLHFKVRLSAKSLLWKSVFIHIEIESNYHNKNFALRLALKERLRRTRKWIIGGPGLQTLTLFENKGHQTGNTATERGEVIQKGQLIRFLSSSSLRTRQLIIFRLFNVVSGIYFPPLAMQWFPVLLRKW